MSTFEMVATASHSPSTHPRIRRGFWHVLRTRVHRHWMHWPRTRSRMRMAARSDPERDPWRGPAASPGLVRSPVTRISTFLWLILLY